MSSIEAQFLESADLTEYEGQWVAILDKKVVAHAKALSDVYGAVLSMKLVRTPLFHRIPKKDEADTFVL